MKKYVPPIKSQGIKTKLVDWIKFCVEEEKYDRWIEPFMGTGAVAFNVRPQKALLCDTNPHLIKFYNEIKNKNITSSIVRDFLQKEGEMLNKSNGDYYYEVRTRFNETGNSLDFLFLSRSCFNGMMRFNKSGGYNVPFCRKPNRFAPALITKISNQVKNISEIIEFGDYTFLNIDFKNTIDQVDKRDIIYCDPPYIGRHVDYFDSWSEEDEYELNQRLYRSGAKFILSTWLSNKYRTNDYVFSIWKDCNISTKEHFYHVGGKEVNRNAVYEALLTNFEIRNSILVSEMKNKIKEKTSLITYSSGKTNKQLDLVFE